MRADAAESGTFFPLMGRDSVLKTLIQVLGGLNGMSGRYEYIVDGTNLTHQMFVPNGTINGIPIKP